jgi:hypothetical protein
MASKSRMALPPAGIAIKVALSLLLFILLIELFSASHPFSERLLPQPTSGPQLKTHGSNRCLPQTDETLNTLALSFRQSCAEFSPHKPGKARIGVVTAQFGDPEAHYSKALQTHHLHSMIHSTELHVLCEPMIDDLWNKPAFILALLLDEMQKPEHKRLEWIFWVDRDTIILDQCRPISSFLPPAGKALDGNDTDIKTYMLISNDPNGLNNGVFAMRVSHWSINLLLDTLAFHDFKPEIELQHTEQSAMEHMLKESKFAPHVQYVPQQWFNAYPQHEWPLEAYEERTDEDGLMDFEARRGDFLVHFAGHGDRARAMMSWLHMVSRMGNIWEGNRVLRDYTHEIERFWDRLGVGKDRMLE